MEYVKDINLNPLFEYKILCINNKHIYKLHVEGIITHGPLFRGNIHN